MTDECRTGPHVIELWEDDGEWVSHTSLTWHNDADLCDLSVWHRRWSGTSHQSLSCRGSTSFCRASLSTETTTDRSSWYRSTRSTPSSKSCGYVFCSLLWHKVCALAQHNRASELGLAPHYTEIPQHLLCRSEHFLNNLSATQYVYASIYDL